MLFWWILSLTRRYRSHFSPESTRGGENSCGLVRNCHGFRVMQMMSSDQRTPWITLLSLMSEHHKPFSFEFLNPINQSSVSEITKNNSFPDKFNVHQRIKISSGRRRPQSFAFITLSRRHLAWFSLILPEPIDDWIGESTFELFAPHKQRNFVTSKSIFGSIMREFCCVETFLIICSVCGDLWVFLANKQIKLAVDKLSGRICQRSPITGDLLLSPSHIMNLRPRNCASNCEVRHTCVQFRYF